MQVAEPHGGWEPLVEQVVGQVAAAAGRSTAAEVWQERVACLAELLDLAVLWNARINLTAARDPAQLVDLFIADAVVLAALRGGNALEPRAKWVDIGSGAGAPGLPLALLDPSLRVTLVEPRTKRVAFLRTALGSLGRTDISVERRPCQSLTGGQWDVASSRATLPPTQWLREGTRLAQRAVWVLLARGSPPSLPGWRPLLDVSYRWPLTGAQRRAVCFVPAGSA